MRFLIGSFLAFIFGYLSAENPHVEICRGAEITPFTKEFVQICHEIYREAPYFYNGDDAGYESYLESYSNSKNGVVCLVFSEGQIVGLAAGIPLQETREVYQQPFIDNGYCLSDYFYIGEFGLNPQFKGKDLENQMYQKISEVAASQGFKKQCLWELNNTYPNHAQGYVVSDQFWKREGFISHPELNFDLKWTNIGDKEETTHHIIYWLN